MKKLVFALAAVAAVTVACQQEPLAPESEPITPVIEEETIPEVIYASVEDDQTKAGMERYDAGGGTYKYRHHWELGDQIYVYHGTARDTYNCTNASSGEFTLDGSAHVSGLSKSFTQYCAVFSSVDSSKQFDLDGNNTIKLYSAYEPNNSELTYTSASDTPGYGNVMVACSGDGLNYTFTSLVGWLKLQLKGVNHVNSITINADYSVPLGKFMRVTFPTSGETIDAPFYDESAFDEDAICTLQVNLATPVALNESTPTDIYIALPPMTRTLASGIRIGFEEGGYVDLATSNSITITPNAVTPMAAIGGTPVNLSATETANSYIATNTGHLSRHFRFNPVKVDGSSVGDIASVSVLWETDNTTTAVSVGDIITDVVYEGGVIKFALPENNKQGNALIAAINSENKILWSWHIWRLNEAPLVRTFNDNGQIMDLNLGALSGNAADGRLTWGLMYQWGRKDPFMGAPAPNDDNHQAFYAGTTYSPTQKLLYGVDVTTTAYSAANPTGFYCIDTSQNKNYATNEFNDPGWRATKTNEDPCPPGYIVPRGGRNTSLMSYAKPGQAAVQDYAYWYTPTPQWDDTNRGWTIYGSWHPTRTPDNKGIGVDPYCYTAQLTQIWLARNGSFAHVRFRIGSYNYADAYCYDSSVEVHNFFAFPVRCERK